MFNLLSSCQCVKIRMELKEIKDKNSLVRRLEKKKNKRILHSLVNINENKNK